MTVEENGVRFRVHFEGGHKTGFFCDQRENRLRLAGFCRDRSVLDVCCYTGGFGLYALVKGEARDVTCVDLDEKAVALARENANANQVRPSFVHADAFGYMRQMNANGRTFGVVVLDPPKLIPGRLDVATGKRKYFDLNVLAMGLVEPGGMLLTCSCSGLLPPEEFLYPAPRRGAEGGAVGAGAGRHRRRRPTTRSASTRWKGRTSRPSGSGWATGSGRRPASPTTTSTARRIRSRTDEGRTPDRRREHHSACRPGLADVLTGGPVRRATSWRRASSASGRGTTSWRA